MFENTNSMNVNEEEYIDYVSWYITCSIRSIFPEVDENYQMKIAKYYGVYSMRDIDRVINQIQTTVNALRSKLDELYGKIPNELLEPKHIKELYKHGIINDELFKEYEEYMDECLLTSELNECIESLKKSITGREILAKIFDSNIIHLINVIERMIHELRSHRDALVFMKNTVNVATIYRTIRQAFETRFDKWKPKQ